MPISATFRYHHGHYFHHRLFPELPQCEYPFVYLLLLLLLSVYIIDVPLWTSGWHAKWAHFNRKQIPPTYVMNLRQSINGRMTFHLSSITTAALPTQSNGSLADIQPAVCYLAISRVTGRTRNYWTIDIRSKSLSNGTGVGCTDKMMMMKMMKKAKRYHRMRWDRPEGSDLRSFNKQAVQELSRSYKLSLIFDFIAMVKWP